MQMQMMYGTKAHLDQCEFCPGAVYFLTDTCEIYFDAPDREERIRMTLDPNIVESTMAYTETRVAELENTSYHTNNYLGQLNASLHNLSTIDFY